MSAPALIRFSLIRGHDETCGRLREALRRDRLAHAVLFAGPEGIGKRCVALALAAWLHCEAGGDDACGRCSACIQSGAGSHPDLLRVGVADGKKEIGIERAREVKRFGQLQPVRGGRKVAVIDDADRLTVAAQNALLKTLEEPPGQALLILVTNNADALLPTVRSRCQRVRFSPLCPAAVCEVLRACGVDGETAQTVAASADGSPGRALALRGAVDGLRAGGLWDRLAAPERSRYVALMQLAEELTRPENQLGVKLEMLLAQYRDEVVRRVGAGDPEVPAALRRVDAVHDAWQALRHGNPNRQLLVEALLVRLARG